jgi:hypothetical protein
MRRRSVLAAAVLAISAAGCQRHHTIVDYWPADGPATGGTEPVLSWRLVGGDLGPAWTALRPPRLVVYADRVVVADAMYQDQLSDDDMYQLTKALALRLRLATAQSPIASDVHILDAPDTEIVVRTVGKTYKVAVTGLEELRSSSAYPSTLYEARDLLDEVYQRVVAAKARYTADRVRLVAELADDTSPGSPAAWPSDIPEPALDPVHNYETADLDGPAAVRVIAGMRQQWAVYRISQVRLVRAAWRYLLRHE